MSTTQRATTTAQPITHSESYPLARTAYDRFAGLLDGLDADDWARPTDCHLWSVRDLAGHMVGAMRSAASTREMVSQMREIRARHRVEGGNQTDVMTAVQIRRTAALSPAQLVDECRSLVTPAARGRRRSPAPMRRLVRFPVDIGPQVESWTLGYLVDVVLTRDAWLHAVDLSRAVGCELPLTPDHDGRIVADVVAEWGRRHGQAFDLRLSGPAGGHFIGGGGAAPPLELDAVEFCRTLSGRAAGSGLLTTVVPF